MNPEPWFHAASGAGIFFLTFLSEDSATLAGGLLAGLGTLSWPLAFASCFLGIWVGDLGLYALARLFGRPAVNRFWSHKASEKLDQSEAWFGVTACLLWSFASSFRAQGSQPFLRRLLRMPAARFALVTGILAAGWWGWFFLFWVSSEERRRAFSILLLDNRWQLLPHSSSFQPVADGSHRRANFSTHPRSSVGCNGVLAGLALLSSNWPQLSAAFA